MRSVTVLQHSEGGKRRKKEKKKSCEDLDWNTSSCSLYACSAVENGSLPGGFTRADNKSRRPPPYAAERRYRFSQYQTAHLSSLSRPSAGLHGKSSLLRSGSLLFTFGPRHWIQVEVQEERQANPQRVFRLTPWEISKHFFLLWLSLFNYCKSSVIFFPFSLFFFFTINR